MIISNDELKKYIFGVVRFDEFKGFIIPRRFTKKQFDYLKDYDDLFTRSKMTASVVIEFFSNTKSVSFDAVFLAAGQRSYCDFDIYVNDILTQSFSGKNVENGSQRRIEFTLAEGKKKIQIYFPCLFETGIKNFRIDDNADMLAVNKDRNILFFGDSITHGYATRFTSLTYANILSRSFNANSLNQAISGDVFNVNNLDEDLDFNPDDIFVAYGTNDWSRGADITSTAKEYFDKLTGIYPQNDIYVILPIYRLDSESEQEKALLPFKEFRDVLRKICEKYKNLTIIDGWDFVPHFPDFYEDGYLHPNDMGFIFYADALKKHIIDNGNIEN